MDQIKEGLSRVSRELHSWSRKNESARTEWRQKGLMGFIATLNPLPEAVFAAEQSYLSQLDSATESHRERPVFILGCTGRCGSTLLQRVLSSLPHLFIWGENFGVGNSLMSLNGPDAAAAAWFTTYYRREMECIARHLDIKPECDLQLFKKKIGCTSKFWSFGPEEYLALSGPDVIRVAEKVGYDILAHPRMKTNAWLKKSRW